MSGPAGGPESLAKIAGNKIPSGASYLRKGARVLPLADRTGPGVVNLRGRTTPALLILRVALVRPGRNPIPKLITIEG